MLVSWSLRSYLLLSKTSKTRHELHHQTGFPSTTCGYGHRKGCCPSGQIDTVWINPWPYLIINGSRSIKFVTLVFKTHFKDSNSYLYTINILKNV